MKKVFLIFLFSLIVISCGPKTVEREVVVLDTSYGNITIDLFEEVAPKHVTNFKRLVSEKFYDGLYFHRVIPGFMIQGGEPNTRDEDLANDGMGQPGQPTVPAEFSKIPHKRGILSMARKDDINSATSQFFILVGNAPWLDKQYSVFGKVIEGMEVADKIVKAQRDKNDNPLTHIFINKAYLIKKTIMVSEENSKDNLLK